MTPQQWLNSDRDYKRGVEVYNAHGTNINLKRLFARPYSRYSHEKLIYELMQIANNQQEQESYVKRFQTVQTPQPTRTEDFAKREPQKQIDYSNLPPQLNQLNIKKGQLYHEASYCHAQMHRMESDEERFEYAKKIVSNFRIIDGIWEKLDHFQKTGTLLTDKTNDVDLETLDEAQLIKHRNNLRAHISKLKKKSHRVNDLLAKQKELEQTELKLKQKNGAA